MRDKEFEQIIIEATAPAEAGGIEWFKARAHIMDYVRRHEYSPEQLRAVWKRTYRYLKGIDTQLELEIENNEG